MFCRFKTAGLGSKTLLRRGAAVAEYLSQLSGINVDDDPVEFLIVNHRELVRKRTVLKAKYPEIIDEIARDDPEFEEQSLGAFRI